MDGSAGGSATISPLTFGSAATWPLDINISQAENGYVVTRGAKRFVFQSLTGVSKWLKGQDENDKKVPAGN